MYRYLFYKTYKGILRSGNYNEAPIFVSSINVSIPIIFIINSIGFVLERNKIISLDYYFNNKNLYYLGQGMICLLIWFYNLYLVKYTDFVKKYDKKNGTIYQIPAWIITLFAYFISAGILLISGLYNNHDWIFK